MKYLKLFPTELERIPFEENEYEEPYVGFTQNNAEYSVTAAGSPQEGAKVLSNGDGTFTAMTFSAGDVVRVEGALTNDTVTF